MAPMRPYIEYDRLTSPFFMVFYATVIIEYLVVYFFLRPFLRSKLKLFLWILLVNAITNPVFQIVAVLLIPTLIILLLLEILVVIVEFNILKWILGRMLRSGDLTEPLSSQRIFVISLTANLASFLVGYNWIAFYILAPY